MKIFKQFMLSGAFWACEGGQKHRELNQSLEFLFVYRQG